MTMLPPIGTDRGAFLSTPAGKLQSDMPAADGFADLLDSMSAPVSLIQPPPPAPAAIPEITEAWPGAAEEPLAFVSLANQSRGRLFSFSELGVFGRNAAQGAKLPQILGRADEAPAVPQAPPPVSPSVIHPDSTQEAVAGVPGQTISFAQDWRAGPVQIPARPIRPAQTSLVLPASTKGSWNGESEPVAPGKSGPNGGAKLPARPVPRANPVSLQVAGPDKALMIVAQANGVDAARLRRMIEIAEAEFDVRIAHVQFNGSPVEPSFSSAIGGNHGNRSR